MGGHGGLNILPQKRWNVYRYDNREKVRKDEEAAARDEAAARADSNRRDSDLRLQRLRGTPAAPTPAPPPSPPPDSSGHINLFHGLRGGFDGLVAAAPDETRSKREAAVVERLGKELGRERKKMKKEAPRTVGPEDEKYRMGYGVAGKGVKVPWYLTPLGGGSGEEGEGSGGVPERKSGSGKKTMEELREERVRREGKEKERERALQARARKAAATDRCSFQAPQMTSAYTCWMSC